MHDLNKRATSLCFIIVVVLFLITDGLFRFRENGISFVSHSPYSAFNSPQRPLLTREGEREREREREGGRESEGGSLSVNHCLTASLSP